MHYDIVGIEEFANNCCFSLSSDQVLTTTCLLRDGETGQVHRLEKSVDLKPAVEYVTNQLAAWHLREHGEDPEVAGWTDYVSKAVSTVKKVAQNKTVKTLYQQAKPFLKSAVKDLPGGESAMELATKAAKVYHSAKKGSEAAMKKVKEVVAMAKGGDAKAQYAVRVMDGLKHIVQEKLAGNNHPVLPSVAAALQKQRRAHGASYYNLGVTCVSGELEVGSFSQNAAMARKAKAKAATKANRKHGVADHRRGPARGAYNPGAGPVPAPLAAAMSQPGGGGGGQTTPDLPSEQYAEQELFEQEFDQQSDADEAQADEGFYDEDGEFYAQEAEGDGDEVSGWTFNRPYRTTPQMLVQARKSPGIALSVREVYNRGLGRPATDLEQMASAAFAEF